MDDPRDIWLSEHFRLSDFLGNHSVYARGFSNPFVVSEDSQLQIENAEALCQVALEPLLERFGPVSIAYGFISPDFSRRTVKYQDPDKPSHHRWDLGAAADVVSHRWVQGLEVEYAELQACQDENEATCPAMLAHTIDNELRIPYSRLITYSESPYVCMAVSSREVAQGKPRRAFYENRFTGVRGVKPEYLQLSNSSARTRVRNQLAAVGLDHPWQGGGYPSYHGGGINQYQHMRVSRYTTVLDWLFNLKSISEGHKNVPSMLSEPTQDALAAAGVLFDTIIENTGLLRLSVLRGFVARSHPSYRPNLDWSKGQVSFEIGGPRSWTVGDLLVAISGILPAYVAIQETERGVLISADADTVLADASLV